MHDCLIKSFIHDETVVLQAVTLDKIFNYHRYLFSEQIERYVKPLLLDRNRKRGE